MISTVKRRVLIFCELIVNFFSCSNIPYFQNPLGQLETIWHLLISLTLLVHNHHWFSAVAQCDVQWQENLKDIN